MELVEGEDLSERISRGPIPMDEALPIGKQIAEALEAAHEQRIIHRDLKPANVKVRPDGTVKVLDFGLAKLADPVAGRTISAVVVSTITSPALMTGVGVLLGTAGLHGAGTCQGGKPAAKRSDIWAFGCVLYEMLTGKRAFAAEDTAETHEMFMRQVARSLTTRRVSSPRIASLSVIVISNGAAGSVNASPRGLARRADANPCAECQRVRGTLCTLGQGRMLASDHPNRRISLSSRARRVRRITTSSGITKGWATS
jgi:serine/threonine protein kinase